MLNLIEKASSNTSIPGMSCSVFSLLKDDIWIIDSGATKHIYCNTKFLISPQQPTLEIPIKLPNGHSSSVKVVGSVRLNSSISLQNVLYVPSFRVNLLSVRKLTQQMNCSLLFTPAICMIQDLISKKVIVRVKFYMICISSHMAMIL